MKKIGLFSIVMIAISFLISCEKKKIDEFDLSQQALIEVGAMAIIENLDSYPASEASVVPVQIPGENRGGNRTCEEVAAAFSTEETPVIFMCDLSEKIDYNDGSFASEFPEGLNVTTDGTYVSFDLDECLEIEGQYYKVGAVIVKGSNQANVYFYPDGTMGDKNLAAPINSSGNPAGLSNLTFCFVECNELAQGKIIGLKCLYYSWNAEGNAVYSYALSTGGIYPFDNSWCSDLGFNEYKGGMVFDLVDGEKVGMVEVSNDGSVTVTLISGYILWNTHLFVGMEEDLPEGVCPDYSQLPWIVDYTHANSLTITP